AGLPPLGPGPRAGVRAQAELDRELAAMPHLAALPPEQRELVRALVLLWHDHLEAAHTISQGIETADGAFVHGIRHRRGRGLRQREVVVPARRPASGVPLAGQAGPSPA